MTAWPGLSMNLASTGSADTEVPQGTEHRIGALARYVFTATLVRSADGGAVVAIVLLAHACGMPGWLAGLLGASITAPHLLGPFIARQMDTARDGRKVIAFSAVLHGVLLGTAALLMPVAWAVWPAILLFVSRIFGPMLTGGISSRLPSIACPPIPPSSGAATASRPRMPVAVATRVLGNKHPFPVDPPRRKNDEQRLGVGKDRSGTRGRSHQASEHGAGSMPGPRSAFVHTPGTGAVRNAHSCGVPSMLCPGVGGDGCRTTPKSRRRRCACGAGELSGSAQPEFSPPGSERTQGPLRWRLSITLSAVQEARQARWSRNRPRGPRGSRAPKMPGVPVRAL